MIYFREDLPQIAFRKRPLEPAVPRHGDDPRFFRHNQHDRVRVFRNADAGPVPGVRLTDSQYRVQINNPSVLDLQRKPGISYVELGDPGVPHGVVEYPGLTFDHREPLRQRAKALRYDPAFPKGANINFYTRLSESEVRVLTYERGVEDYTLACGTGCGSVTSALYAMGTLPQGKLTCYNPGGVLQVQIREKDGVIDSILLEGPAEILKIYEI